MVSDPAPTGQLSQGFLLVGLLSLVTVVATEAMAVATVMPAVEDDLGGLFLYGWVFSAFQLGTLVGIVLGGISADRYNPAAPLAIGFVVFCAGLMVAALAPSMGIVVLGRMLQGFGAGVIPTVAYVCVGRGFRPVDRPRVFAYLSAAWILPSLVAPLVASRVTEMFGWRWVFAGLVPVALIVGGVALVAVARLGRPGEAISNEGSVTKVVVLVVGATGLLAGATAEVWWIAVPLVVIGSVLLVQSFRSLTPPGTLRLAQGMPAAIGLRGVLTFAFFASDAFVPYALTSVRGQSIGYAGWVLASASLTWAAGAWLQARLAPLWSSARIVRLGATSLICGLVVYLVSVPDTVPVGFWFLGSCLAGFGMGTAYSPLSVVTLDEAEPTRVGEAATALQLSDVLGIALGTGIAGAIVAAAERNRESVALAAVLIMSMSIVVAVFLWLNSWRVTTRSVPQAQATAAD